MIDATDLGLDISDAVQSKVVGVVEVAGEGDVGKVSGSAHLLILLASLLRTPGTDDVVLELRPGAHTVRGLDQVTVLRPPPAASSLEVTLVWIHLTITATHWRQRLLVTVTGTLSLLRTHLLQDAQLVGTGGETSVGDPLLLHQQLTVARVCSVVDKTFSIVVEQIQISCSKVIVEANVLQGEDEDKESVVSLF